MFFSRFPATSHLIKIWIFWRFFSSLFSMFAIFPSLWRCSWPWQIQLFWFTEMKNRIAHCKNCPIKLDLPFKKYNLFSRWCASHLEESEFASPPKNFYRRKTSFSVGPYVDVVHYVESVGTIRSAIHATPCLSVERTTWLSGTKFILHRTDL